MKTLFLFIPNFVFSSDLLHTEFIKYISQKHRVFVFSPVFKSNPPSEYYQSPNVEYISWDTERPRFWLFFSRTLRLSLIREFDHLEYFKLRRLTKRNLNWKRNFLRRASFFLPRFLLTARFFTKLESWLLPNQRRFRELISKHKPDLFVTCTPGFSSVEAEAIIMADKNGLKTVSINSSWDNYTTNSTKLRKTDYLICWNKIMKAEAITLHNYLPNNIFISGVYRFDHHFKESPEQKSRNDFLKSKNLDPKLKTLFITTVSQYAYPLQYNAWREIIKMRDSGELGEDLNILIRLHPNDNPESYKEFRGAKNLHIEPSGKRLKDSSGRYRTEMSEEDLENLRLSLKYTDVNINFRSSVTLEVILYNKPVINIALYDYAVYYQMDHYIPIVKSGAVRFVESEPELALAIRDYLKNPKLDSDHRQRIIQDYAPYKDGLAYKRSVDFIDKILRIEK